MKKWLLFLLVLGMTFPQLSGQSTVYKKLRKHRLSMEMIAAEGDIKAATPALVFFFGGGWNSGTIEQFRPQAEYFSKKGITCFLVDYRVKSRHNTPPFYALQDAKSAIRFVRKNARKFNINPDQIIASGGSAGGHLAAACAHIPGYNDPKDDSSISCVPNALILFNPVIDNSPAGYGHERISSEYPNFSPLHNIRPELPPTIFFLGTEDSLIPVETAKYYRKAMERCGNRCDLHLFEGAKHGFFNPRNPDYFNQTVQLADEFLQSLGLIKNN